MLAQASRWKILAAVAAVGLVPAVDAQETQAVEHEHEHVDHQSMDHGAMMGMFGVPMTREASGTSWQPEGAPHAARMRQLGGWHVMTHGSLDLIYDDQGGARGRSELFGSGMFMATAQRPWQSGTFGLRAMLSPDPLLMGKDGYPLLLQTGETADGRTPLIDRQHPHDLFMELAVAMSQPIDQHSSAFLYLGLPGEPALGPPAFMHRFSAMANPEAPLAHHWLDSTHVTFGVVTAGYVRRQWKLEVSAFNGHEPDENRYDIEVRKLDSSAARLSWNPSGRWAAQVSYGRLRSTEQLEPGVDADRATASVSYHRAMTAFGGAQWQGTLAWGRNDKHPGKATQAFLAESALEWRRRHTLFGRLEVVGKDELFDHDDPRHGRTFDVNKLSIGYAHAWPLQPAVQLSAGLVVTQNLIPRTLAEVYGDDPRAVMAFARLYLR